MIVSPNTKNGPKSFLLNLFTPLIDAESYLAILNNGMSGELLTLI